MKNQSRRVLTQKDMKEKPKKLSEYEKLVQVCKVARELYHQVNSQEASNTNNIGPKSCSVYDQVGKANVKSLGKKPIQEDGALFFNKDTILLGSTPSISGEELLKGSKTNMGESLYRNRNNFDSVRCSVFDQVGQVNGKSWGKKPTQEDGALFFNKDTILVGSTRSISGEELLKGSKTNMGESLYRNNINSVRCSVFDQVGQVNGKSWGKKPIQEDGALFFNKDKILVGSTSCIPREELFKGSKTNMGESSSGRFCKLKIKRSVDDHDYLGDKKVVNGNDYDGYFLNKKSDRFLEEKVCDDLRETKRSRKCSDSSEDDQDFEKKKKQPRTICNARQRVAKVTSPLPVEFKNEIQEMGGSDIKLIIQKKLYAADILEGQNRFSIPMKQILENFLTDEEESILDQRFKDKHVVPLMVPLIEPNLEKTQINFRKWACNSSYVLSSPWKDIRERNELKVDMEMQLWSFRVDGALNMALVKVLHGL